METEWIMKAVSDALARCDLCGMMNKEFWKADLRTQICFYLKERTDLENGILPCNKFGIGRVWLRLGCYEEACVWLEQIPKEEACYGEARVWLLFAKAMVMLFRKDREPLEKIKAELEMIYQEKEDAQRSLCILKGIVDQESYFTLEQRQREYFFKKLHEVWKAYAEGNKKQPKGKEAAVIWEEQEADMRRLAKGGMTWQIDKNAVAEFIFTLCRRLYEAAEGEEEKGEVSQKTWTFWQEYYQDIPVEDLSTENLYMLWHLEDQFDSVLLPKLEGELCSRTGDKAILQKALEKEKKSRERTIEIQKIFERLLKEDMEKWGEDFRRWILREDRIWAAKYMEFFEDIEKIADDPEKSVLYEVYRQYQITFKANWHRHWVERLNECGVSL